MGMEQFGINVDVDVDTDKAHSSLNSLNSELEKLESFKKNGISLDLGLGKVDTGKLNALIEVADKLKGNNFAKSFEISDKALNSLKQLKETAEQVAKLSKSQTKLVQDNGVEKQSKDADSLVTQYKNAQKEIKALQSQMSKTKDDQVLKSLLVQLGEYEGKLKSLYGRMNNEQRLDLPPIDKRSAEELERVYGNVFDSIQAKARKFQTEIDKLSKTEIIDRGELERVKGMLDGITSMNFKSAQSQGFSPFSNAFKDIEKLQTSISALKKGGKLDGLNQSDSVKEWKNLNNIINATKKDLAGTTNSNSTIMQSSKLAQLNKELTECYNKMSDVDKKTVDTISGFDKMKLDTSFAKSAEKMLKDVKTLENAFDGIGKKGVFDDAELKKYRTTLKNITTDLNSGIAKGALNEFNLSYAKNEIEGLENSIKRLGNVAERELKVNKFASGMDKQLSGMKDKFGDALPEKEIKEIQKLMDRLDVTPMSKLPSAFENINNKIQETRKNAEETSKTFKEYDKVTKTLKDVGANFEKLGNGGALNSAEIKEYESRLKSVSQVLKGMDLKSPNSNNILKTMFGDIEKIQSELKEFKMPDFLAQWKKMDSALTGMKKKLSTTYDSNIFESMEQDIKSTELAMTGLVQKMSKSQLDDMLNISNSSNSNLSNYFREEADKSIKALDKLITELEELENKKIGGDLGIGLLIAQASKLKNEFQAGATGNLLDPSSINKLNVALEKTKNSSSDVKKEVKKIEQGAETAVKKYSQLSNELLSLERKMSTAKTPQTMDDYDKQIARVTAEMKKLYAEMNSAKKGSADLIDVSRADKLSVAYLSQIDKIRSEASRLDDVFKNLGNIQGVNSGQLGKLKTEVKEIADALGNDNLNGRQLAQLQNRIQAVASSTKGLEKIGNFSQKIGSELDQLESSVSSPKLKGAIKEIRQDLMQLGNTPVGADGIDKQMAKIEKSLTKVQNSAKKTGTFFNDIYDSMRTFTLGNIIGDAIQSSVYNVKETLVGMDSALRDMMKVAPADFSGTSDQLKQVKNDAIEVAKAVGSSSEDVIQGMAKALQTGAKTMGDALEIAKQSTIFANVGDLDQGTADTYIASIMSSYYGMDKALQPVRTQVQGMGKDYNNLTNFMDLANYAGNNFAISTGDVGTALQKSGSILSNYGVSLEDSVAMIVGAK